MREKDEVLSQGIITRLLSEIHSLREASEKVTFKLRPKRLVGDSLSTCNGRSFQDEGTAKGKVWRWERAI